MVTEEEKIDFANLYNKCKAKGIRSIKKCYHPKCNSNSINSHILQKNGILSELADKNRHVWEFVINQFKSPQYQFKKTGINQVYSFNCFCNEHDSHLFKKIEQKDIDFEDYESCLLFTLRTIYNEIFKKQVNLKLYECCILKRPKIFDNPLFHERIRQEKLGLNDLFRNEKTIWDDLEKETKSFVFEFRAIPKLDACISAFFNYETTDEMSKYIKEHRKDMDRLSDIFINCFPYGESSILLMGYNKIDEKKVKGYFYTFFKEKENRILRYLTNLFLFRCETWVCSDKFYNHNIKGVESLWADAAIFSTKSTNERKIFPLNFFQKDFKKQLIEWKKNYEG